MLVLVNRMVGSRWTAPCSNRPLLLLNMSAPWFPLTVPNRSELFRLLRRQQTLLLEWTNIRGMGSFPRWKRLVTQRKVWPLLIDLLSMLTSAGSLTRWKQWWPELEEGSLLTRLGLRLARVTQSPPSLLATTAARPTPVVKTKSPLETRPFP